MEAAKTYPAFAVPEPQTVVLYCSDPRFQVAIERFLTEELGLAKGKYMPLVVGGSVASLAEPMLIPKEFKFLKTNIEHYISRFSTVSRIVLVNHEDCAKYRLLKEKIGPSFHRHESEMVARQIADLARVAKAILAFLPRKVDISGYYARFANAEHTQVIFEEQKLF